MPVCGWTEPVSYTHLDVYKRQRLQGELARVNGMLNNERFLSKAPESKVAEEREKLDKYTQMMAQVQERLAVLGKSGKVQ